MTQEPAASWPSLRSASSGYAGSILAIDCGSTATRALLIDQVEGEYRLVARAEAPSTQGPPWNDLMVAVRQALEQISEVTGWRLVDEQGHLISPERGAQGVDLVVAVTSLGERLRLLLVAPTHQASLDAARRALPISHAVVERIVTPAGHARAGAGVGDDLEGEVGLILALERLAPDAVVLVGGTDGGASEPVLASARAVAWACSTLPALRRDPPIAIYAGNAQLIQQVAGILGSSVPLRLVSNVRPAHDVEDPQPLQAEIETLHRGTKLEKVPGVDTLAAWSGEPVSLACTALARTIRFLAASKGTDLLAVDVGGATTTIAAVADGRFEWTVRTDLGLGYGVDRALDQVSVDSLLRWLPFEMSASELCNALYNKAVRPYTVPQTHQDLLLDQAIARELICLALTDLPSPVPARGSRADGRASRPRLIIGSGRVLTATPNVGQAALTLLDSVQPVGMSRLGLDRDGLLTLAGAVALRNPLAAAQLVGREALLDLGTAVAPVGVAREGEVALTCQVEYEDGRSLDVEVPFGSLQVIPLSPGQRATLQVRAARHLTLEPAALGRAEGLQVQGGAVGIILDARGRPLVMAGQAEEQRSRMQRWLQEMQC